MPSFRSRLNRFYIKRRIAPYLRATCPLERQRAAVQRACALVPRPRGVRSRHETIDSVPVCWINDAGSKRQSLVVYLHGGGYCLGSIRQYEKFGAYLSRASGSTVLLVDYRLAPEHPYPAALDDTLHVLQRLSSDLKYSAEQIAVGGDSAGGGLALATVIAQRDRQQALPAAVFCLSPWTDLTLSGDSMQENARSDFLLNESWLRSMAEQYVPQGQSAEQPLISPLMADLAGLPPLLLQVAADEVLRDDSRRLVRKARSAGVDVEFQQRKGLWHVWQLSGCLMPESIEAMNRIARFLQRRLSVANPPAADDQAGDPSPAIDSTAPAQNSSSLTDGHDDRHLPSAESADLP